MAYGSTLVDTISSSGNLTITGNVTTSGTITTTTVVSLGNVSASGTVVASAANFSGNVAISGYITNPGNPAFMAGIAATTNSTYTANPYAFAFNVTVFNKGNCFNTTNGRFTAPVAGVYLFGFSIYNGSNPFAQFIFRKNGSDPASFAGGDAYGTAEYPASVNALGFTLTSMLELAVGDYVTVGVRSGSSGTFYQGHTYFFGHLVG